MEINIKDTLRMLRRNKNITQEALAEHLGITPQSVGKWERGEGFPDITMLPRLAFYFDVTVDELLDVGQVRIDQRIQEYREKSREYKKAGENEKNLALWETAYREFPSDCRVMEELMDAINRDALWPCPKEKAERIISLGEQILQKSGDKELRESALQELCHTYKSLGEEEKAIYYAGMGGSFYTTQNALLSFVQEGEAGVEACQNYILTLLTTAARIAVHDLTGKKRFALDEEIRICEFGIDLLKLLFSDDNAGFYANDISRYYSCLATRYAAAGNGEKALDALENAGKYAYMGAEEKAGTHKALVVNRLKYDPAETTKNYLGNACNLRLKELGQKEFDFIRRNQRFAELERKLKRSAEPL